MGDGRVWVSNGCDESVNYSHTTIIIIIIIIVIIIAR